MVLKLNELGVQIWTNFLHQKVFQSTSIESSDAFAMESFENTRVRNRQFCEPKQSLDI